jgi:nicotinamidase-related amidase
MSNVHELPIPAHFNPANAESWSYRPDVASLFDAAVEWRKIHQLEPAGSMKFDLHLLLVDEQKDFCLPAGTLYVGGRSGRGAIDDSRRVTEFIYRNLAAIKHITTTMDTHLAYQIFSPSFWVDSDGQPLPAHQQISSDDIRSGRARPNPAIASWVSDGDYQWLLDEVLHYTVELEREGKYTLYLWPPHVIEGEAGHALVGIIEEARLFHSYTRDMQSWLEIKGNHPLTEHYSALGPEVLLSHDGRPLGEKNMRLLKCLMSADAVVIAGQAASHCVRYTIEDLLNEMEHVDPTLAAKVYLLADCMSPVAVPDGQGSFISDFTEQAAQAQKEFAARGAHIVQSTQPLAAWPEFPWSKLR